MTPQKQARFAAILAGMNDKGQNAETILAFIVERGVMPKMEMRKFRQRYLRELVQEGQLFTTLCSVNIRKGELYYFGTKRAAAAFEVAELQRRLEQRGRRRSYKPEPVKKPVLAPSIKAKPVKAGPAHAPGPADFSNAVWTKATKPVERYAVEPPAQSIFGSGPGHYAIAANSCAARQA